MKRVRVLSYNDPNNGSCLISWEVSRILLGQLNCDVKLLNYAPINRWMMEALRALKPHFAGPFFNLNRHRVLSRWMYNTLPFESYRTPSIRKYLEDQKFDALVVTKPSWDITNEWSLRGFPTIFWLPMQLDSKKIAFGVSAHRSMPELVTQHRDKIRKILDTFSLIGVRDEWTYEIVSSSKTDTPVWKIPDPVFMHEFVDTNIGVTLQKSGLDLSRPIVAFAAYGRSEIFKSLASHFRQKGFQILGLSMFSPHVDVNLGDILDPFQWTDVFRYLSFCITDRFHGTVISLLAKIPFTSIEPFHVPDRRNSKIYDLLQSVDRTDCYADIYDPKFQIAELVERIEFLRKEWEKNHKYAVSNSVQEKRAAITDFVTAMRNMIG